MAADTEYISSKDFNTKFKNYLRDFYVYQFKNKNLDYYGTGSFSRSRMAAVIIASKIDKRVCVEDFFDVKMQDITIKENYVEIKIDAKATEESSDDATVAEESSDDGIIVINKPLSEMFKYLHTAENKAFFITGNTAKITDAGKQKIEQEILAFEKKCPSPATEEKWYRFWGDIYLEEANEIITTGTYYNDSLRLQALVSKMAKVEWSYGRRIDHMTDQLTAKEDDNVTCVTTDTRELSENPFHSLYRYCNRYNDISENHFDILFWLICYYNIDRELNRDSLHLTQRIDINKRFQERAAILFSVGSSYENEGGSGKTWDELTHGQKTRYAKKVINRFMTESNCIFEHLVCKVYEKVVGSTKPFQKIKESKEATVIYPIVINALNRGKTLILGDLKSKEFIGEMEGLYGSGVPDGFAKTMSMDVFAYLITNKKKIIYDGHNFCFVNQELVEKKFLYISMCASFSIDDELRKELDGIEYKYFEIFRKYGDTDKGIELAEPVESQYIDILREYIENSDNLLCTEKQFLNILREYVNLGIIIESKEKNKLLYCLSQRQLSNILPSNEDLIERFYEMVSFFSQTLMLGEVGSYVLDRLPIPKRKWKMFYKHNYIIRALNDYNNIDLLFAMQNPNSNNHYWVELECRDAMNEYGYQHFICYPLEIKENVSDGRQYLVYYHPLYRSIAAIRIDFIDNIKVGTVDSKWLKQFDKIIKEDINNASNLIKHTWGLKYSEFYEGNVKTVPHPSRVTFKIRCDAEVANDNKNIGEKHIIARITREFGKPEISMLNDNSYALTIVADVVNPWDMLHWIRTYTTRIYDVDIKYNSFMDDVARANKMYIDPVSKGISVALLGGDKRTLSSNSIKFTPIKSKSDSLFNEFYSDSFRELGKILFKYISSQDKIIGLDCIEKLKVSYVGESSTTSEWNECNERKKVFDVFLKRFCVKKYDGYKSVYAMPNGSCLSSIYDLIPLTEVEIQWLLNILDHKLARAFLSKKEIDDIKANLPDMTWLNIVDSPTVQLIDQHSDDALKEYYKHLAEPNEDINTVTKFETADLSIIVRKMMHAIQERKLVKVMYRSQNGKEKIHVFVPYCIEYSKRDDRFRVKAVCKTWDNDAKKYRFSYVGTFPVDQILSYEETGGVVSQSLITSMVNDYKGLNEDGTKKAKKEEIVKYKAGKPKLKGGIREITVVFSDSEGILDRILTEFSCYEKTCVRWGNGQYRMDLKYYEDDCNEIVIRLLGYGSLVFVSSEDVFDPVVKEIKARYKKQVELYKEKEKDDGRLSKIPNVKDDELGSHDFKKKSIVDKGERDD